MTCQTCGAKLEVGRALLRWLAVGCVGAVMTSCETPSPEIDAEAQPIEPALTGSARVPYSMSASVALLDENVACTVDTYESKIDCVDRSGAIIGRFGSTGEGPGEFLHPRRLVRGIGGSLGVIDNSRGKFFAFTRMGELVAEVSLPIRGVFVPASPFGATIVGAYIKAYEAGAATGGFANAMVAAEIRVSTGELVREWRPASVPEVADCGIPYFGFPALGGLGDETWVFMACDGHIAYVNPDGETTVIQAPTYGGELPGERDLEEHRDALNEFRRLEDIDSDLSGSFRRFAETPSLYYLARGQETFDEQGRLWISTRRNRNESSFIDVYAGSEFVGTIKIRDRMIDFDVLEGTLAVLVERQAGPDDADGVPDRGIDWYDLGGF